MFFTDWEYIKGIKLGFEVLETESYGETLRVQVDLFFVRVLVRYYGQLA